MSIQTSSETSRKSRLCCASQRSAIFYLFNFFALHIIFFAQQNRSYREKFYSNHHKPAHLLQTAKMIYILWKCYVHVHIVVLNLQAFVIYVHGQCCSILRSNYSSRFSKICLYCPMPLSVCSFLISVFLCYFIHGRFMLFVHVQIESSEVHRN